MFWREGLELASYNVLLLRWEGRDPEGVRRDDGGGGRHFWHIGGPSGWLASMCFLVGRFSGEAASGQGRVRRGALRMGEGSVGLPRIGLEAPCLGGGPFVFPCAGRLIVYTLYIHILSYILIDISTLEKTSVQASEVYRK